MRNIYPLLALLFITLISACEKDENAAVDPKISDAEYEVYSTVLKDQFKEDTAFIVRSLTDNDDVKEDRYISDYLRSAGPDNSAVSDLIRKNDTTYVIEPKFNSSKPVNVVSESVLSQIYEDHGENYRTALSSKYSGASRIVSFSRVGFNKEETEAVVYFSHVCGGLCGEGSFAILKLVSGTWKVIDVVGVWIS